MPSHIDVRGASGVFYRFRPSDDPRTRSTMSGNFVYIREGDGEVVYLGEADNLMVGIDERWGEAVSAHGATGIFVRPIVARATRAEEQQDILRGHCPAMNDPLPEEPEAETAKAQAEVESEPDDDLAIPERVGQLL